MGPGWIVAAAAALLAVAVGGASGAAPRPEAQLPNLVALAPFEVQIDAADGSLGSPPARAIRFSTGAANRSKHALELLGQPSSATAAGAQQCVAWAAPRICTERENVGSFEWHPAHGHYHFQDFALYELRRLRKGKPDMRKGGLVSTSGKVSYCIIDYEQDDESSRELPYTAPYPLYYSCLAGPSMQGISPGWKDVYGFRTHGQQFPLNGIADGTYALVVMIDPAKRIHETNETDNSALAQIRLSEGGTKVDVLCTQEPGDPICEPVASGEPAR